MAKAAKAGQRSLVDWFKLQPFDAQGSIIQELNSIHDTGKASRIRELEEQLAALKGGMIKSTPAKPLSTDKPARKPNKAKGVKVEPKYRDKKTGQTWAGRGVMPTWMREYVKKGAKPESFLIRK